MPYTENSNNSVRSMKYLMISVFFGSVLAATTQPYIIITLMKELHAGNFQLYFIDIISRTGGILALPIAIIISNINAKKASIMLFMISRTMLFFIVYQNSRT